MPTVFDRNPKIPQPAGRGAWAESFGPALEEMRTQLRTRRPQDVAQRSGATWDETGGEFSLDYFGRNFRITWPALTAFPQGEEHPCSGDVQALFLYYLSMADGTPPSGRWIGFGELPDGWLYQAAFQGYSGDRLARAFENEAADLRRAAVGSGGQELALGSGAAFQFTALPQIPLALVYWQGDEEFPAEAKVLFDESAGHYLPIDGLAMLGSRLVSRLVAYSQGGRS